MIEYELTYLPKYLPEDLKNCRYKEIIDIYIPASERHPNLRLRKNGDKFEMTKKILVNESDSSEQIEQTIVLSEDEFSALAAVPGKRVHKNRYYYDYHGRTAEIDIFLDDLAGLVVVDFEFASSEEKNNFVIPDFCLADITQEEFVAGGMLCGKKYEDIEDELKRFGYERLTL
jgi:CYTH domain-containing protein